MGGQGSPPHIAHGCGHQIYRIWGASGIRRGPLGPPWAPWGGPWDPWGPLGPLGPPWAPGAPNPLLWVADKFKTLPENRLLGILESKTVHQKVGIWAPGPPRRDPGRNSEPDPGFLKSQMVPRRPIWWRKGVTWGPLGFWAQPAHPKEILEFSVEL